MKLTLSLLFLSAFLLTGASAQDADMQAMMDAWMKVASPGEHHQQLNPLAGDYTITGKFRMDPNGEWTSSTSNASLKWILDGRFLMQEVKSASMPMSDRPFEGLGFIGFDNAEKKFVSMWIDNHSTMLMTGMGEADPSGKVITLSGKYMDPMTRTKKDYKWVYRIQKDGDYVLEMYNSSPDGSEYMSGELAYRRRPS